MLSARSGPRKDPRLMGFEIRRQRVKRGLTALLTSLLVFSLLLARLRPESVTYAIGDRALRTLKAQRATTYVDTQETERLRETAATNVLPSYTRDAAADDRALQALADVYDVADEVRHAPNLDSTEARAARLRNLLDLELSPVVARSLVESPAGAVQRLEQASLRLVRDAMGQPLRPDSNDVERAREGVWRAARKLPMTARYRALVSDLAQQVLQPNQLVDAGATAAKREAARKQVDEVRKQVQPGDVIVSGGEAVTQRHLDMFEALGMIQPRWDYRQAAALLGVLLLLTLTLTLYIRLFAGDIHADDRAYAVLCVTLIAAAALFSVTKGVALADVFCLSIATSASIFLALALRPVAAVGAALYLGALAALSSPGNDARLLLTATVCATLAAYVVRPREGRGSTIARAALVTALINAVALAVGSLVFSYQIRWDAVGYAAVGGMLSAVVAAGIITMIERPLGLTTPLLLLELQNPNEPLLKRMLTEAPGSYQSSVMVANLAEPAAEAVGADPVLTRTACMYHDIGKLKRPYFFIENQFGAENPHSRLSPHLSALVIMAHVKEGVELAREAHLPPVVAGVVSQHHGTGLASFMYQRAQAEADEGEEVRESDYRYPGPKPQTRENAIIMLADTVEAAARAMADANPDRIEELVQRLVDGRIADDQLDECPLTFADITVIKKTFAKILVGMFHQRLDYPSQFPRREDGSPAPARPPARREARAPVGDRS